MWADVLARFEKKAPASVMAKLALEQAIAPEWVDQVFEEHRQRQYSRELLFSTIVKLMSLVSLGLKRLKFRASTPYTANRNIAISGDYSK